MLVGLVLAHGGLLRQPRWMLLISHPGTTAQAGPRAQGRRSRLGNKGLLQSLFHHVWPFGGPGGALRLQYLVKVSGVVGPDARRDEVFRGSVNGCVKEGYSLARNKWSRFAGKDPEASLASSVL